MKVSQFQLCCAFLAALGLASCKMITGGSSGGTQIKDPTVDEMAQMEKQWGTKPRESRLRQPADTGEIEAQPSTRGATHHQPAPEPAPAPVQPPASLPEAPISPGLLQKLKN